MKELKIEAALDTPEIQFNPHTRIFTISGISHPENAKEFYSVIIDWLDEFHQEVKRKGGSSKIIIDLNFKYINSASYKYLREVMLRIASLRDQGLSVEVLWNYHEDDEDLLHEGVVLFELPEISLPYRCIPYS